MRGAPCATTPCRREQHGGSGRVQKRDDGYQVHRRLAGDARVEGGWCGTTACARIRGRIAIGRCHQFAVYEVRRWWLGCDDDVDVTFGLAGRRALQRLLLYVLFPHPLLTVLKLCAS